MNYNKILLLVFLIIGLLYGCGGVGNIQVTLFHAADTTIERCLNDLELDKTLLDLTATTIYRPSDSSEKVRFIKDGNDTLGFSFGIYSVDGVDSAIQSLLILTYYGKLGDVLKSEKDISFFAKRKCLRIFNKNVIEEIGKDCQVKFENDYYGNMRTAERIIFHK